MPASVAGNPLRTGVLALVAVGCCAIAAIAVGGRPGVWTGIGLFALLTWRWSYAMMRRAESAGSERSAGRYRRAVVGLPVVIVAAFILLLARVH
ncbi:MAG: hypothetical protein ACRDLP_08120 [Solirubrobacteraceae bacterium]